MDWSKDLMALLRQYSGRQQLVMGRTGISYCLTCCLPTGIRWDFTFCVVVWKTSERTTGHVEGLIRGSEEQQCECSICLSKRSVRRWQSWCSRICQRCRGTKRSCMIRIVRAKNSSQETKSWCCFSQPQKKTKKTPTQWLGPYSVVKRVGVVDFEVDMAGSRKPRRVHHVNMLRELMT